MKQTEKTIYHLTKLLNELDPIIGPIKKDLPEIKEVIQTKNDTRDLAMVLFRYIERDRSLKNMIRDLITNRGKEENEEELPDPDLEYSNEEEKLENFFKIPLTEALDLYTEQGEDYHEEPEQEETQESDLENKEESSEETSQEGTTLEEPEENNLENKQESSEETSEEDTTLEEPEENNLENKQENPE